METLYKIKKIKKGDSYNILVGGDGFCAPIKAKSSGFLLTFKPIKITFFIPFKLIKKLQYGEEIDF